MKRGTSKEDKARLERERLHENLNELAQSREYKKDFDQLKKKILSPAKRRPKKFAKYHFPDPWVGDFKEAIHGIPFGQLRRILKNDNVNVNEHRIWIPRPYSHFKNKWNIDYLFDPSKQWPDSFNPFVRKSAVEFCLEPISERQLDAQIRSQMKNPNYIDKDPEGIYKLHLEIDVRYPIKTILYEAEKQVKFWRSDCCPPIPSPRGTPKRAATIRMKVKKILERQPHLREKPRAQQAKQVSEELDPPLSPITIMRRYLPRETDKKKQ